MDERGGPIDNREESIWYVLNSGVSEDDSTSKHRTSSITTIGSKVRVLDEASSIKIIGNRARLMEGSGGKPSSKE